MWSSNRLFWENAILNVQRIWKNLLIHTLLHEVAHSIWHNKFQYDEEKVNKFRDGINKLIEKYGAITDYVQNDHVDLERINEIFWDHRGKHGDKYAYALAFLDSTESSRRIRVVLRPLGHI